MVKFINILFVLILYMLVAAEKLFKMLQKLKYYVWMGGGVGVHSSSEKCFI